MRIRVQPRKAVLEIEVAGSVREFEIREQTPEQFIELLNEIEDAASKESALATLDNGSRSLYATDSLMDRILANPLDGQDVDRELISNLLPSQREQIISEQCKLNRAEDLLPKVQAKLRELEEFGLAVLFILQNQGKSNGESSSVAGSSDLQPEQPLSDPVE